MQSKSEHNMKLKRLIWIFLIILTILIFLSYMTSNRKIEFEKSIVVTYMSPCTASSQCQRVNNLLHCSNSKCVCQEQFYWVFFNFLI